METMALDESEAKVLFVDLPVLWLEPILIKDYHPGKSYICPLYKESTRRGTLSTTGHSTNYVMALKIPTIADPTHWIRSGVACLC